MASSLFPHVNQSWEWGDMYRQVCPTMMPIRLLLRSGDEPVGALQGFAWNYRMMRMGIIGGGPGGGGPVISSKLQGEDSASARLSLMRSLMKKSEDNHCLRFLLYASPQDEEIMMPLETLAPARKWTPVIHLSGSSKEILNNVVEQKTRNQIERSLKNGVCVLRGGRDDLPHYHRLQQELVRQKKLFTSKSNSLRDLERFWDALQPDIARLYVAKKGDALVAAALVLTYQQTFFYKGGMTTDLGRELYAMNALQWRIISDAVAEGARRYNLMGATADEKDSRYSITRFKLGFGATLEPVIRYSHRRRFIEPLVSKAARVLGANAIFPLPIFP